MAKMHHMVDLGRMHGRAPRGSPDIHEASRVAQRRGGIPRRDRPTAIAVPAPAGRGECARARIISRFVTSWVRQISWSARVDRARRSQGQKRFSRCKTV